MDPSGQPDFYPGASARCPGGRPGRSLPLASVLTGYHSPGCRIVCATCCLLHPLTRGIWYFAPIGSLLGSLRSPLWALRACTALRVPLPLWRTSSPYIWHVSPLVPWELAPSRIPSGRGGSVFARPPLRWRSTHPHMALGATGGTPTTPSSALALSCWHQSASHFARTQGR